MKKQFVVIGLGRFGGSVTRTLCEMGYEVLAIDKDLKKVQDFANIATHVYQADSTEDQVLKDLGVRNFDHAVVAIGDDLQASIMTTLRLKDLGVKKVSAKAIDDLHHKVLDKVGADHIIHPEHDTGVRVAHQITSKNLLEYIELSPDYSLVEIAASRRMDGKSLKTLNVRAKYGCNIMALKSANGHMNISPSADDKIIEGDILVIIGSNKDIARLEKDY